MHSISQSESAEPSQQRGFEVRSMETQHFAVLVWRKRTNLCRNRTHLCVAARNFFLEYPRGCSLRAHGPLLPAHSHFAPVLTVWIAGVLTLAWLGASAAAHAAEWGRTVCKKISVRTQLDSEVRHRRNHARASGRNQPCLSRPSLKTGCRLWRMRICTALRRGGAPSLTNSGGLHR